MTSKLSTHWQITHKDQQDISRLKRWGAANIKIIFNSEDDIPGLDIALASMNPVGRVIVRYHMLSENFNHGRSFANTAAAIAEGKEHADRIISKLWPVAHNKYGARADQLLWTGLNEPNLWAGEPPELTALYYAAFMDALHAVGLSAMVLNFGVGWPGNDGVKDAPPIWAPYKPVLDRMKSGDVLGLHEYWPVAGPEYAYGWLAGRFTQMPAEWKNVPIVIGEGGLDNAVAPGVTHMSTENTLSACSVPDVEEYIMTMALNHKKMDIEYVGPVPDDVIIEATDFNAVALEHFGFHGLSPNHDEACRIYMGQLKWYEQQLAKHKQVLSFMPFTYDFSYPWDTFDIRTQIMMENNLLPYVEQSGGIYTGVDLPAPIPDPTPVPIPDPTPIPATVVPVIDISNQVHDLAWLESTTGIHIDTSLCRTGGLNWKITSLRALRGLRYLAQVRTAGKDRAVGRSWPGAPNGWGDHAAPDDVTCPPEAKSRIQLTTVVGGPAIGSVEFIAGPGDRMDPTKKDGVNLFFMPTSTEGSDVLRNVGVLPGDITYTPTFEMVLDVVIPPAPDPIPVPVPDPVPDVVWGHANLKKWKALIEKHATATVSAKTIGTIIMLESDGNPFAISEKGAVGLMQVMPKETGEQFKDRPTKNELLDPDTNIMWGVKVLSEYMASFDGSLTRGLAAYFGGPVCGAHLNGSAPVLYLQRFVKYWLQLWAEDLPFVGVSHDFDIEKVKSARWHAEEAVRSMENAAAMLKSYTISNLYDLER